MQFEKADMAKLNEALHYIEMKRFEKALDAVHSYLAEKPNDGYALYLAAFCSYNLDDYAEAESFCIQALEQNYNLVEVNYLLGRIYMDMDELVKAEQCYIEALRNNPNHGPALAAYGMLMLKTGHEKKADELINEAMGVDPEDSVVLHYKFMYYLFKNKKSEQIYTLQRFLNSADSEVSKLIHLGMYNMHNKNYKAARENYRQAFLLNPTDQTLLGILGDLDRECSLIYAPQRFINKVGPAALWISFIVINLVLGYLGLEKIQAVVAFAYIILVFYSWFLFIGYGIANKIKKRRKRIA